MDPQKIKRVYSAVGVYRDQKQLFITFRDNLLRIIKDIEFIHNIDPLNDEYIDFTFLDEHYRIEFCPTRRADAENANLSFQKIIPERKKSKAEYLEYFKISYDKNGILYNDNDEEKPLNMNEKEDVREVMINWLYLIVLSG